MTELAFGLLCFKNNLKKKHKHIPEKVIKFLF